MDWTNGEWSWFFSFSGILSVVSVTIIAVVGTALYREWRHYRMEGSDRASPERE